MIMPSEHSEGFALNLGYIHHYYFRNVIYLLCMKHDDGYHMGPGRNNQASPLNSIQLI